MVTRSAQSAESDGASSLETVSMVTHQLYPG